MFENPQTANTANIADGVTQGSVLDVSLDGQRFAIVAPRVTTSGVTLTVAVNWMADLVKQ